MHIQIYMYVRRCVYEAAMLVQMEMTPVMDVVDSVTPLIIKRYLSTLSAKERVCTYLFLRFVFCLGLVTIASPWLTH